jgi:hypothetical protein
VLVAFGLAAFMGMASDERHLVHILRDRLLKAQSATA